MHSIINMTPSQVFNLAQNLLGMAQSINHENEHVCEFAGLFFARRMEQFSQ